MQEERDMREHATRSDQATAAIIEQALRLCATDGIDSAIRLMEERHLDRQTILRVLCSPRFHR
jgi:hypothetical protein